MVCDFDSVAVCMCGMCVCGFINIACAQAGSGCSGDQIIGSGLAGVVDYM